MGTLRISVVSAEKALYDGEASLIVAPGQRGELGILPQHAPLLTTLKPGILKVVKPDGEEDFIYIAGGVIEIQPDMVTVLADVAERGEDLDEERANQARAEAERALQSGGSDEELAIAQAELARAVAQIELIRQLRRRR